METPFQRVFFPLQLSFSSWPDSIRCPSGLLANIETIEKNLKIILKDERQFYLFCYKHLEGTVPSKEMNNRHVGIYLVRNQR